jgi:hypothetical protein
MNLEGIKRRIEKLATASAEDVPVASVEVFRNITAPAARP